MAEFIQDQHSKKLFCCLFNLDDYIFYMYYYYSILHTYPDNSFFLSSINVNYQTIMVMK